jgi:hypothetical protein
MRRRLELQRKSLEPPRTSARCSLAQDPRSPALAAPLRPFFTRTLGLRTMQRASQCGAG